MIDWRALESAHALLAVAMVMAYLLAPDLGASKSAAAGASLGMGLGLLLWR